MLRPVTLFTGQWADMKLERLAAFTQQAGFDGLELACWGEHLDVARCLTDASYVGSVKDVLERRGLSCWALGAHLVGQATCDPIDSRHKAILPPEIWGDGEPAGVRRRAANRMKDTARAAAQLDVRQVNGFTGSQIWHLLYSFPPNDFSEVERGYQQFAETWSPILDVFESEGVRFGLEVHPTEIAYDFATTRKALEVLDRRQTFGLNLDPSHLVHQSLDPSEFAQAFSDRIYHVHVKDVKLRINGRQSILGSHLDFGDPRRGWDFVSPGRGDVDFDELFRALDRAGYEGPLSIEWEDAAMDREHGAKEALAYVRRTQFPSADRTFDAAMRGPHDATE
jgi:sugar phosphate isomerase/epimerase